MKATHATQQGLALVTKRLLDIFAAALALGLASPLLMVASILVWLTMGRPILFRQRRPGKDASEFSVFKFRTMVDARNPAGALLPDHLRITRTGLFLRKTSIDELPQLLNVVRGDMSLVGPRPLLVQYLDRYTSRQARRHEVLPGITGLAQVKGRNAITWEEKFELDVWYVENWSLGLDLKILAMTAWKVLRREGINPDGESYQPEFMGSETSR